MIFSIAPNLLNRLHRSYGETTQIGPAQHVDDLKMGEKMYFLTPMDTVSIDRKEVLPRGDYIQHITIQKTAERTFE
jgi:hypothetical protein